MLPGKHSAPFPWPLLQFLLLPIVINNFPLAFAHIIGNLSHLQSGHRSRCPLEPNRLDQTDEQYSSSPCAGCLLLPRLLGKLSHTSRIESWWELLLCHRPSPSKQNAAVLFHTSPDRGLQAMLLKPADNIWSALLITWNVSFYFKFNFPLGLTDYVSQVALQVANALNSNSSGLMNSLKQLLHEKNGTLDDTVVRIELLFKTISEEISELLTKTEIEEIRTQNELNTKQISNIFPGLVWPKQYCLISLKRLIEVDSTVGFSNFHHHKWTCFG